MMKKPEISKDAAIFSFMAGVMPPLAQDVWLIYQQLQCLTIIHFRPPYCNFLSVEIIFGLRLPAPGVLPKDPFMGGCVSLKHLRGLV